MIGAQDVHARLGNDGWRRVLIACGIAEGVLRNKHGPCPACGGKDRFRFDNKGRGAFICNQCGAGDGFSLLGRVYGWSFKDAHAEILRLEGWEDGESAPRIETPAQEPEIARPTRRVLSLLRESCAVEDCDPAMRYLASRSLWPLPAEHLLRAHPSVEYWHERQRVGRYPALLTAVKDAVGETVTAHVTYLTQDGEKLSGFEPRKILSPMTGRESCCARVMRSQPELGIAEGIETALSAAKLSGIATWAALNSSLLAKFCPPPNVEQLVIFADRDVAGLEAATQLMQRLQGRVRLEIRTPQAKDWNDVLRGRPQ